MSKAAFSIEISKPLEYLRESSYHQQLGRKMCAAFIAQQQGIALETAFMKVSDPVGDLWLVIAEVALQALEETPTKTGPSTPPSALM